MNLAAQISSLLLLPFIDLLVSFCWYLIFQFGDVLLVTSLILALLIHFDLL